VVLDGVRLGEVGHLPAVDHRANDALGHRRGAAAVLLEEPVVGRLEVDDAQARAVAGGEGEHGGAKAPGDVGGVPHEGLAAAQVLAGALARGLHDLALVVGRRDVVLFAQGVERDDGQAGEMAAHEGVFARARQARHDDDLAGGVVVSFDVGQAPLGGEEEKARVVGGEAAGPVVAALVAAVFAVELDVVEHAREVGADPAADVGLGDEREQIAAGDEADLGGELAGVGPLDEKEGHLVVANEAAHHFAQPEGHAGLPQDAPGHQLAPPRVALGGDAPVVFDARRLRLGHVVQQTGEVDREPVVVAQETVAGHLDERLEHHARVNADVALGVVHGVLRARGEGAHPVERGELGPGHLVRGRRRGGQKQ
jgi:hypothetical protein